MTEQATVDVENLNESQLEQTILELSEKVTALTKKALADSNLVLAPYGLKLEMNIAITSTSDTAKTPEGSEAAPSAE